MLLSPESSSSNIYLSNFAGSEQHMILNSLTLIGMGGCHGCPESLLDAAFFPNEFILDKESSQIGRNLADLRENFGFFYMLYHWLR